MLLLKFINFFLNIIISYHIFIFFALVILVIILALLKIKNINKVSSKFLMMFVLIFFLSFILVYWGLAIDVMLLKIYECVTYYINSIIFFIFYN